ncbi:EAL domain-containing protein, partial [Verminephrobacter sp. Larva24]
ALLRWRHPELGVVAPAEFIPVAENSGQIVALGEWVLHTAARDAKRWLDMQLPLRAVSVNLSAVQFRHPQLPEMVTRCLQQAGLPARRLELELTEGAAVDDPVAALAMMDQLHDRGVRLSMDDFGTGYSSLSCLKRFQIYKLKIDQSFVRDLDDDANDRAIVSAIIRMAQALGMQTTAEGVETDGQLQFLRAQGCDEGQGYLFSRPLPADAFEAYLRAMK